MTSVYIRSLMTKLWTMKWARSQRNGKTRKAEDMRWCCSGNTQSVTHTRSKRSTMVMMQQVWLISSTLHYYVTKISEMGFIAGTIDGTSALNYRTDKLILLLKFNEVRNFCTFRSPFQTMAVELSPEMTRCFDGVSSDSFMKRTLKKWVRWKYYVLAAMN